MSPRAFLLSLAAIFAAAFVAALVMLLAQGTPGAGGGVAASALVAAGFVVVGLRAPRARQAA